MPLENRPINDGSGSQGKLAADPIVLVEGLHYQYPGSEKLVLAGIDLKVMPGEFLGITGPSGAGKSTLCLCLKGLIPHALGGARRGTVQVQGLDTATTSPARLAETVAIVFQDPESQIIGLTVSEDLAFGPENLARDHQEIGQKIEQVLEVVGLRGFAERETYGLSGGEKQRVAIAAALMMEPSLLILDEPTSELDPVGKQEVFQTVARLRRERQVTVIMVEHEIEALAEVADRIVVLERGGIVADAPPRLLFRTGDLFQQTQRIRVPQAAQVLLDLEAAGLVDTEDVTPYETEAVETLSRLLRAQQESAERQGTGRRWEAP